MSLRRSSRGQAKAEVETPAPAPVAAAAPKKRGRKSQTTETNGAETSNQNGVSDKPSNDGAVMPPPPSTPNKRRKVATDDVKPPPMTPTPSLVGLMASSPGIKSEPSDRPVDPNRTNASLVTPGGTKVPAAPLDFWGSPSKASHLATTSKSLLDDACAYLIEIDPKLKDVISRHHCKLFSPEGLAETVDPFSALVSGILAQQVSGAAAKSIKNKFIALFTDEQCPGGFPHPKYVSKESIEKLRSAGLSQRKAEYVKGLAEKFDNGELTVPMLMTASDEEVMEKLVAVRGLGAWSVQMFMCFGLKRMDVFATGDLGVQRGMAAYVGRDVAKLKSKGGTNKWKYMSEADMLEISAKFAPYRTLFMWYMWRIEDVDTVALEG